MHLNKYIIPSYSISNKVFYSTSVLPKEYKIKIGKSEINYLKVGNGPNTVLCAPGALGTIWTDFKPQIEGFNRDKFTLIVWDPPGYGKSSPVDKEYYLNFYENDADSALQFMKELNIPKFSLMGFCDGSKMSLILAAKYPQAIKKLVVWAVNSFYLPNELEKVKFVRDVNNWSNKVRDPFIEVYGKQRLIQICERRADAVEEICVKKRGNICSDFLKDIKCPTYILYGELDPLVDPVHATHLQTHILGSRIHLYPEGKHHIHLRYAEDFNKRVQEFLLE